MDFYEMLREIPEEAIDAVIKWRIKERELIAAKNNSNADIFGYKLENNPNRFRK